jgi:antitoxin FitA
MPKMIQLRHVPDALHRRLKARAALEGMSLSDYLVREVRKVAERPSVEEIRARLTALAPVRLKTSPTEALREERDRRQATP